MPESRASLLVFQAGLVFVTFEQVRPLGVMLSDWCFFLSFVLISKSLLGKIKTSGLSVPLLLILGSAVLSLHDSTLYPAAASLVRLIVLFGLIAPLSVAHSKGIRKNLLALCVGISLNCFITVLQASIFPDIVDLLSINPPQSDAAVIGRFQGLTEFPVTLGLAGGLAALLGIGLFSVEKKRITRWALAVLVFVCCVAALLSGSRTFFACLIPALLVFALTQKYRRRSILYAVAALVALWGSLNYLAPKTVSQYSDRLGAVGFIDYDRLAAAAQIAIEISEKPFLGWGVDHFDEGGNILVQETGEIAGAHNTFLRYWYAAGLLGGVGFLLLFAIPMRRIIKELRTKPPRERASDLGLALAACVFLFIASNLGPYLYNRYLYVPIFISAGFAASVPVAIRKRITSRSESRLKSAVLWTAVACSVVVALAIESLHGLRAIIVRRD